MKKLAVIFGIAALCIGWFLYPPMRSDIATWRFKTLGKCFEMTKAVSEFMEFLGFGPMHTYLRKLPFPPCSSDESLKITKENIGGIPALLFRPKSVDGLKPALVYFHGGGWTLGSPDLPQYCHLLSKIAKELQIVVVAFDYRKAPEAPFPAPFDDCLEGLLDFVNYADNFGVDVARVAVAGDSAGGNLALAVTAHLHSGAVKGSKFRVARLGLLYPALQALDFNLPSFKENAWEFLLTRTDMLRYWRNYIIGSSDPKWVSKMLNNSHASEVTRQRSKQLLWDYLSEKSASAPDAAVDEAAVAALAPGTSDPLVSPILFPDEVLRQLPPVYLLSCEFDVLRDEAIALAKRLTKLGHPLEHDHSMHYHGVLLAVDMNEPEAIKLVDDFISFLKKI